MNFTIELTFSRLKRKPSSEGASVHLFKNLSLSFLNNEQVVTKWWEVSRSSPQSQVVVFSIFGGGSHGVLPHCNRASAREVFHFMLDSSVGYLNEGG